MVESLSLQQILSMGTQVEKIQQVQQNQHDVNVRAFAQDMQDDRDEKKIEVPGQEEGSEIQAADDQAQQKLNQERKGKEQKDKKQTEEEENKPVRGIDQGNRINIVV